jgi:hypothetical protein
LKPALHLPRASWSALLLLITSALGFAASAKGYIRAQCPMTGGSGLHITEFDGRKLSPELLLRIPEQKVWGGVLGSSWYDYPGESCGSGKCEPAIHSKVQILRISYSSFPPFRGRRITRLFGNFEIELQNGRRLTGPFQARFLNLPRGALCE